MIRSLLLLIIAALLVLCTQGLWNTTGKILGLMALGLVLVSLGRIIKDAVRCVENDQTNYQDIDI